MDIYLPKKQYNFLKIILGALKKILFVNDCGFFITYFDVIKNRIISQKIGNIEEDKINEITENNFLNLSRVIGSPCHEMPGSACLKDRNNQPEHIVVVSMDFKESRFYGIEKAIAFLFLVRVTSITNKVFDPYCPAFFEELKKKSKKLKNPFIGKICSFL
ncbi:MAG: hypothetical protein U9R00_01155 [Patescibacteria group bacterium]|nr:hypothetical protein [Patescibacteria group bacterium]